MTAISSNVPRSEHAAATLSAADEAFFRMTASLFAPSFLFGAGVLLGTYDDEDGPRTATPSPVVQGASRTVTATTAVRA